MKDSRNISTAWIDYKKAYDSIPHDWLIETLKIHQFDEKIVNFFQSTINNWKTSLRLSTIEGDVKTGVFDIKAGIFQGDCLSGIQFVLCLLPVTLMLVDATTPDEANSQNFENSKTGERAKRKGNTWTISANN